MFLALILWLVQLPGPTKVSPDQIKNPQQVRVSPTQSGTLIELSQIAVESFICKGVTGIPDGNVCWYSYLGTKFGTDPIRVFRVVLTCGSSTCGAPTTLQ